LAFTIEPDGSIHHLWKTQVGDNSLLTGLVILAVDYTKICIYAGSGSTLECLNARTGETKWKSKLKGVITKVDVKLMDSLIVCGCYGYVYGFSPSGEQLWECNLVGSGYLSVTLLIHDGVIYASTLGFVYAISQTGQILWKNENVGQGYTGISLAILPDKEISFGMRGFLRRIKLDSGQQLVHSYNLEGTGYWLVTQLLYQNILFVSTSGEIRAYNPSDYKLIWKNTLKDSTLIDGFTLIPFQNNSTPILIVGYGGFVISLNPATGEQLWSLYLQNGIPFVSIAVFGEMLVAGSCGKIFVINGSNGQLVNSDHLSGFGYQNLCLVSKQQPNIDQQSSNLIFYEDKMASAQ